MLYIIVLAIVGLFIYWTLKNETAPKSAWFFKIFFVILGLWYLVSSLLNLVYGGEALLFGVFSVMSGAYMRYIPYAADAIFIVFLFVSGIVFVVSGLVLSRTLQQNVATSLMKRLLIFYAIWLVLKVVLLAGNVTGIFGIIGFVFNSALIMFMCAELEQYATAMKSKKWAWAIVAVLGIGVFFVVLPSVTHPSYLQTTTNTPGSQTTSNIPTESEPLAVIQDQDGSSVHDPVARTFPTADSTSSIAMPSHGRLFLLNGQTAVGYVEGNKVELVNTNGAMMIYFNGIKIIPKNDTSDATNVAGVYGKYYDWSIGKDDCGLRDAKNTCDVIITLFSDNSPAGYPPDTLFFGIGLREKNTVPHGDEYVFIG